MSEAAEHAWGVYRETALASGARRRQLRKRDFLAGFEACRVAVIAEMQERIPPAHRAYDRYAPYTGFKAGDRVSISIREGREGTVVRNTSRGMVLVIPDGNLSPATFHPRLLTKRA